MNHNSNFPHCDLNSSMGDFNSVMMSQEEMLSLMNQTPSNPLNSGKASVYSKLGFSNMSILSQKKVKMQPKIISNAKDANYDKYLEGEIDDLDEDLLLNILGELTPIPDQENEEDSIK
jgi:hypothetical protein